MYHVQDANLSKHRSHIAPSFESFERQTPPLAAESTQSRRDSTPFAYHAPSPFDSLPIELQIEIFTHCLPSFPRFDINDGPLLISRVCRAWKDLVLDTPKFWSTFEIEITGSGTSLSPPDINVTNTMDIWLKRSKNYPLTVRIVHIPVGRVPDQRSAQLLAALIPQSRRWRHVEFILPASTMSSLQKSLPPDFPTLQSLTLQLKGLWSSTPSFNISMLNIPWHQLTVLELQLEHNNLVTLDKCLDILSLAERLTQFTVNASCILDHPETYTDRILLPKLETLHLILHGGSDDTQIPSERAHAIDTLSIAYLPLSEHELIECLSELPNVTHLDLRFSLSDIENDPITDSLIAACTLLWDSPSDSGNQGRRQAITKPRLPLLESLDLQCSGKRYTVEGLLAFINSRRQTANREGTEAVPNSVLKSFHLLSTNSPMRSMEKRVQEYRSEGFDISVDSLVIR
ncbi:hypothetical protein BDZ97DRAFT_2077610 [Flammula alnicola]|nr:hypothetical protein BDZ97DRAFT_2077610 [Flammula alnicola]